MKAPPDVLMAEWSQPCSTTFLGLFKASSTSPRTGQLTITYRAGTPLHTRLACRVRAGEQNGRKVIMTGELTVVETGQLVAEAHSVFITVDRETLVASMNQPDD